MQALEDLCKGSLSQQILYSKVGMLGIPQFVPGQDMDLFSVDADGIILMGDEVPVGVV
jgi:hypothetical protein